MATSKKHSSAKGKASSVSRKDKVSDVREYGEGLVGSRVRVWWPIDREFYMGVVDSFNASKKKHLVVYDDGDQETLNMKKERWELIEEEDDDDDDDDDAEAEAEADEVSRQDDSADESSDATPEAANDKKVKTNGTASEELEAKFSEEAEDGGGSSEKLETEEVKQTSKKGKLGDVGGKIVAAASRMSGRFQLQNGHGKETQVSENGKKRKASSKKIKSSNVVDEDGDEDGEDEENTSDEDGKKEKKRRISSEKSKSTDVDEEDVDGDDEEDEETASDEDSKPLMSLLKENPVAMEAMMKKMKRKKEKEAGEGSAGNDKEE